MSNNEEVYFGFKGFVSKLQIVTNKLTALVKSIIIASVDNKLEARCLIIADLIDICTIHVT